MAGIIVIIAGAILFVIAMLPKKKKATMPLNIPDIHKVNSLQDVVMSVNHGRIYPYFTGMSIEKAQKIANDVHPNPTALNQTLQMQELMGIKMFFDVPISNKYIERVSVHLNNNRIISSISIDIKDWAQRGDGQPRRAGPCQPNRGLRCRLLQQRRRGPCQRA